MRKVFVRRQLPHWYHRERPLFVTFRLFGSLPASAIARIRHERTILLRSPILHGESDADRRLRHNRHLFALVEREVDASAAADGPSWLGDPRIAEVVRDAIIFGANSEYDLHRFTIMPNHVHMLITPIRQNDIEDVDEPTGILRRLKRYTAMRSNAILGRKGRFWQTESFDHWVRDQASMDRISRYIDENPVKAKLVEHAAQWPWGSAFMEE